MEQLIDINSLIIQAFNIAIIVFVLHKFFFKPYLAYLDEENVRRKKLEEDVLASKNIISDAQKKAEGIVADSRQEAKKVSDEIVQNARDEALQITEQANREAEISRKKWFADVEHERKVMTEELREKVLSVAIKMNEKLFGKSEANEDFLKKAQKDITL